MILFSQTFYVPVSELLYTTDGQISTRFTSQRDGRLHNVFRLPAHQAVHQR